MSTTFVIRPSSTVPTCPAASERITQRDCSADYKTLGCTTRKGPKKTVVLEVPDDAYDAATGLFNVDVNCYSFIEVGHPYDPAFVPRGVSASVKAAAAYLMEG